MRNIAYVINRIKTLLFFEVYMRIQNANAQILLI
jgi:hypothetical protein